MIKAASLAIEINLLGFSQFLHKQGLQHRINEESGKQVIWVENQREADFVNELLNTWSFEQHSSEPSVSALMHEPASTVTHLLRTQLRSGMRAFFASPITISLVLLCLLVAIVSALGTQPARVATLFYPLIASDSLLHLLADVSRLDIMLRTLTPMFLHFGELHLVFNMLWLWYFGKQLEAIHPAWLFVVLIILTSFASNTAQYLYSNHNNFGGMSGVVYGLVGYTWVIHSFMPKSYLLFNRNMFVFFIVALVVMELVASSWIATAAHVGGLVVGLLLGLLSVLFYRFVLKQDIVGKVGKRPH